MTRGGDLRSLVSADMRQQPSDVAQGGTGHVGALPMAPLGGQHGKAMDIAIGEVTVGNSLNISCPMFFRDPEFVAWLNNGKPKFTWHQGGEPADWSDVVVLVDPGLTGEGTDSDMPEHIWDRIVEECRQRFKPDRKSHHIAVRLVNVE